MNGDAAVWADRVLVALADLAGEVTETDLIEQVAVRFADRFGPSDRVYAANTDCPRWHDAVREALRSLATQIECAGARTASVDVSLTERAGSEIATGFGSTQIGCTNANQTVLVIVTAQPGKAFKKGTATAQGFISACTPNFRVCGTEQDQRTIDLAR